MGLRILQWISVGDDRTCPACAVLDGHLFTGIHHPTLPLHPHCRCALDMVHADVDRLSASAQVRVGLQLRDGLAAWTRSATAESSIQREQRRSIAEAMERAEPP